MPFRTIHLTLTQTLARVGLVAGCAFLAGGCEPADRRPGVWLYGETVTEPVSDWGFVNEHAEVKLMTYPWYLIPHAITVVAAEHDGVVYVPSIYDAPADFPGSKFWNKVVASDPDVVLKAGEHKYPMIVQPAANDAEFERGLAALADKYDFWRKAQESPGEGPPFVILKLTPRGAGG